MSTVKDSWVVLLKLRPAFPHKPSVCVWVRWMVLITRGTWGIDMTKFGDLAYRVNPVCSTLVRYVDICNLFFKSNSLAWCIYMIIPPRWVTLKMHDTVILHFHCSYHGLFASTFKVLIGLPLVISLTRCERQDMVKINSVTFLRARTLPSQNACRLRVMAWVHAFNQ